MENMSPAQRHECPDSASPPVDPAGTLGQHDTKRRTKTQSQRRQSAPSLVLTKALTRSRTISRESFQVPVCPETCPLIQAYLASAGRSFLLHGHAQLKTGLQTQERHLFLFSDTLLVTKAKAVNQFKLKAQARLNEMWLGGCVEEVCEGSTVPEHGFVMGWPTCNCVATFSSSEQNEKWLSLLKSLIREEKEREEPKTIALSVHAKGINTVAHAKTLPVSNSDSTNEVIRLALQQFGISGNVKDYQLWVISKRDNTPYPLIGHEFPFSIHVHHTRAPPSKDVPASCDRQAAAPAAAPEPPPGGRRCQFVLKLRPVAHGQASVESAQKHFKRRRSLINWAFWRGPAPHPHDPSSAAAGAGGLGPRGDGCLFGQPLSSLCLEDTLPKPITDMLFFLYHEGSWTRGIFRRSAGARAVRELRDSLDAGLCELPLTRDHVFIIAGVFKDFLRNIPGSLLLSELYEEWAEVVEEVEEEEEVEEVEQEQQQQEEEAEQVQALQRLIGRLPAANGALLRYVVALLHGIQGNARHNQMTSFNLSVCIAPSMLWAAGPSSPEQEGRGAKMVCDLVRFMIDHCQQILGHAASSVFGGPPQRRGDEDPPSEESWSCQMTDSSYDSLENELDDTSSGGSPPPLSRRRHRPVQRHRFPGTPLRGSLDSVLTLSDLDPDSDAAAPVVPAGDGGGGGAAPGDPRSPGQRRCSEPAIAYAAKQAPPDAPRARRFAGEEEEEEEEEEQPPPPAPRSPDQRGSPPDRRLAPPRSPLETVRDWTALKGTGQGLHPNSWLTKARRLSLTQQDHPERRDSDEDERKRAGAGRRHRGPTHHRSTGSLHLPGTPAAGNGGAASSSSSPPPPPQHLVFYRQPGAALSLFRHQRSGRAGAAETAAPPAQRQRRRSSEPGLPPQTPGRRPPRGSDAHAAGLKVSGADWEAGQQGAAAAAAAALVRGRGQWRRRRHSSVTAEGDFNRLLFSEESYV